jgi:hypothetical protein
MLQDSAVLRDAGQDRRRRGGHAERINAPLGYLIERRFSPPLSSLVGARNSCMHALRVMRRTILRTPRCRRELLATHDAGSNDWHIQDEHAASVAQCYIAEPFKDIWVWLLWNDGQVAVE